MPPSVVSRVRNPARLPSSDTESHVSRCVWLVEGCKTGPPVKRPEVPSHPVLRRFSTRGLTAIGNFCRRSNCDFGSNSGATPRHCVPDDECGARDLHNWVAPVSTLARLLGVHPGHLGGLVSRSTDKPTVKIAAASWCFCGRLPQAQPLAFVSRDVASAIGELDLSRVFCVLNGPVPSHAKGGGRRTRRRHPPPSRPPRPRRSVRFAADSGRRAGGQNFGGVSPVKSPITFAE